MLSHDLITVMCPISTFWLVGSRGFFENVNKITKIVCEESEPYLEEVVDRVWTMCQTNKVCGHWTRNARTCRTEVVEGDYRLDEDSIDPLDELLSHCSLKHPTWEVKSKVLDVTPYHPAVVRLIQHNYYVNVSASITKFSVDGNPKFCRSHLDELGSKLQNLT